MVVYFTQCSSVTNEVLSDGAAQALDYKRLGLMFNLYLLGYGIMALSTFFIGLSFDAKNMIDKALKYLLIIHGVFFFSCLIMPMTGMFVGSGGPTSSGGTIALEIWCAYFLPIGILAALHFRKEA
jgi:polyferredoxin